MVWELKVYGNQFTENKSLGEFGWRDEGKLGELGELGFKP